MKLKKNLLVLTILLLLPGCSTLKSAIVTEVKVPVLTKCVIAAPKKPFMPFSDNPLAPSLADLDLFKFTKEMLAEIELRMGYETQLEVSIQECNR